MIADPQARYYGIEVTESTLPDDDAQLGETHFEDWLSRSYTSDSGNTRLGVFFVLLFDGGQRTVPARPRFLAGDRLEPIRGPGTRVS